MSKKILITGSNGEIGYEVLSFLSKKNDNIIALDINHSNKKIKNINYIQSSINDYEVIKKLFSENQISEVYHFAALLSQTAAKNPQLAKEVNEKGSQILMDLSFEHGKNNNDYVKIFFPSSIAVYGPRKLKNASELDIIKPITIYGKNKLAIEQYGLKKNIESEKNNSGIDFRAIRLPGVISPIKIPFGGTTDFAPQMIHSAFKGENFICKVSKDTSLPFISIEKAVQAIIDLMEVVKFNSVSRVFNIEEANFSAQQLENLLIKHFDSFNVEYVIDDKFQSVADTWPSSLNCDLAKMNWKFDKQISFKKFIVEYLIPITKKYYEENR